MSLGAQNVRVRPIVVVGTIGVKVGGWVEYKKCTISAVGTHLPGCIIMGGATNTPPAARFSPLAFLGLVL